MREHSIVSSPKIKLFASRNTIPDREPIRDHGIMSRGGTRQLKIQGSRVTNVFFIRVFQTDGGIVLGPQSL